MLLFMNSINLIETVPNMVLTDLYWVLEEALWFKIETVQWEAPQEVLGELWVGGIQWIFHSCASTS